MATFAYDALGRRVETVDAIAGTTTRYYYDDQRVAVQTDYDALTQVETDERYFVFGNYIDEVLVMHDGTDDLYYAHDHLYSPVVLYANNGTVVERYEYDAYGSVQILTSAFSPLASSQYANPYTFTGRELDTLDAGSLHLMYYRARTYDPETGRFMQRDPIGINPSNPFFGFDPLLNMRVSLNLFSYVGNNPTYYLDPLGLAEITFGKYIGLGASKSLSFKYEKEDCCTRNGVLIVDGIETLTAGVYAHAGFGLGIKIDWNGYGVDLSWIGPGLILSGEVILERNRCLDDLWKGGGCIRGGVDGGTSLSFSVLKVLTGSADITAEFTAGICIFGDTNGGITTTAELCYEFGFDAAVRLWPWKERSFSERERKCTSF